MWYTNIYINIKVYQKYKGTSIKEGCATRSLYARSGPKAEGVPTNNHRGRGLGPCRLWGGLDKARHIIPIALLVRVQRIRNALYKAVKGPGTRPMVHAMFVGSFRRPLNCLIMTCPVEYVWSTYCSKEEKDDTLRHLLSSSCHNQVSIVLCILFRWLCSWLHTLYKWFCL